MLHVCACVYNYYIQEYIYIHTQLEGACICIYIYVDMYTYICFHTHIYDMYITCTQQACMYMCARYICYVYVYQICITLSLSLH